MLQKAVSRETNDSQHTWREMVLLLRYHVRVLNGWTLLLLGGSFVICGVLVWITLHSTNPGFRPYPVGLSTFMLESGAGIMAGILSSSLILTDPVLELLLVTPSGIGKVLIWRFVLAMLVLLGLSAAYLGWTLLIGVSYGPQSTVLWFLLLWTAPVLCLGFAGLACALALRNAALGAVFVSFVLIFAVVLKKYALSQELWRLLYVPLSMYEPAAGDWWWNRLVLLGCSLLLALWCWWWLRSNERLLGASL